jgi:predicted house-cleaning noncanonical NTP pyrophosphatase (MazG superfamily)
MAKIYDKLVRDKVPDIIKRQHEKPIYRRMGHEEFRRELFRKLKEECNEVENATTREELIEELGDVLEVLKAIASLEDAHFSEVIESAQEKKLIKGGFEKRIYLEKTISRK